jgi:hypothetical protein
MALLHRSRKSLGSKRLQLELGDGATPFPQKDLETRDAVSIPTAPTNLLHSRHFIGAFDTNKEFDTN